VDQRYTPREDYNPFNEEMFPEVVFAVPTRDGRTRMPDEVGEPAPGPAPAPDESG
jgi:hypothetical protein